MGVLKYQSAFTHDQCPVEVVDFAGAGRKYRQWWYLAYFQTNRWAVSADLVAVAGFQTSKTLSLPVVDQMWVLQRCWYLVEQLRR